MVAYCKVVNVWEVIFYTVWLSIHIFAHAVENELNMLPTTTWIVLYDTIRWFDIEWFK